MGLGVHHGYSRSSSAVGVIAWWRWRGEEFRGWRRRWKVGAVRWWRREVAADLLGLAHFGLEGQRQVSQVELSWFRRSRRSV